ncbi:hypothetical protein Vadar_030245 [Vaccinium darrowii]|uniref:Uncharacterized protein n=1 Tax=Vaccinium darrowii TaxID=229202 RepID=A0ACB7ZFG7_9ERIC|nr:hypothetical protein Vadar_030245 [Vaccinium darrowii]
MQEKLQASSADFDHIKYYFGTGPGTFADNESYIDAAFRSSSEGKAYIFMRNEYVVLDYSQGIAFATVQEGPLPICKRFSFLKHTPFVEYGLDAAFGCGENEAVIFSTNECARINYGSNPSYDLKLISDMFPSLQQTRFESGIDAALESRKPNETFLFKDDKCAIIHHSRLVRVCTISEAFPFLKGTPFTCGIQAAFASKITDSYEVLLFKERNWAFIDYGYGCHSEPSDPEVFWTPEVFHPFQDLLPRKNFGLDRHDINHCGCESDTESDDTSGSSRRIYTQEEAQRVVACLAFLHEFLGHGGGVAHGLGNAQGHVPQIVS